MTHKEPLTESEQRLLDDFLTRRPRWLAKVNAIIGVAVFLLLIWLSPILYKEFMVATLGGVLVGVYFEQRHLMKLRDIVKKLAISSGRTVE